MSWPLTVEHITKSWRLENEEKKSHAHSRIKLGRTKLLAAPLRRWPNESETGSTFFHLLLTWLNFLYPIAIRDDKKGSSTIIDKFITQSSHTIGRNFSIRVQYIKLTFELIVSRNSLTTMTKKKDHGDGNWSFVSLYCNWSHLKIL